MTNYAIHSETYRSCTIRIEPDDDSRENPFKEFDCEPTQVLHEKAQDRPRAADSRKRTLSERSLVGRSIRCTTRDPASAASRMSPEINLPQTADVAGRPFVSGHPATEGGEVMALIGYARVSTRDQSLDRQVDELRSAGCERVFAETASGRRGAYRPEWDACLGHLRAGDTLAVTELSRLGRNTGDLDRLLDHLDKSDLGLQILNLGIDTRTPAGRLIFSIVGAVAAMERDLLIERTCSGLAAARARGRVGGRRRSYTPAQAQEAQRLYATRQMTVEQIARAVGSSTSTVYRYLTPEGGARP